MYHLYLHCTCTLLSGSVGKFGMKKKKHQINGGGLGGMVSAMIPGAKVDNKGRIMVNVGTSKETLTFNIGGCLFETYRYGSLSIYKLLHEKKILKQDSAIISVTVIVHVLSLSSAASPLSSSSSSVSSSSAAAATTFHLTTTYSSLSYLVVVVIRFIRVVGIIIINNNNIIINIIISFSIINCLC